MTEDEMVGWHHQLNQHEVVRKLLVLPWCEFLYCDKTCTYDNLALGFFFFFNLIILIGG